MASLSDPTAVVSNCYPVQQEDESESDSVVVTLSSPGSKSNTPTSSTHSATVTPINEGFLPNSEFEGMRSGNHRKSAKRLSRNMEVQVSQETRNVSIGKKVWMNVSSGQKSSRGVTLLLCVVTGMGSSDEWSEFQEIIDSTPELDIRVDHRMYGGANRCVYAVDHQESEK